MEAFADLDAPDTLELLTKAPSPTRARRLTRGQITAALRRANRRGIHAKADRIHQILHAEQLHRSPTVESAYAAIVTGRAAILQTLNTQIDELGTVVADHFGRHPDAEIYASQPGLGVVLGARVLGEFGDDPTVTSMPRPGRTTPAPHRSPRHPEPGRSSWRATPATDGSRMPCSNGPWDRCVAHPAPAPTTKRSATAA